MYTSLLTEAKGHLDHPEDLIFTDGTAGAQRALSAFADTVNKPNAITIKWDGYPALIFGRNSAGQFSIMDKHMFNKADGSGRQVFSPQEFAAYDAARGAGDRRSDLHWIVNAIWPYLEKASLGSKGYYWGDFLFSEPLEDNNGVYTFRANPNGITYKVADNSEFAKQYIRNKSAGIAVHQYLAPTAATTDDAVSLDGTIGKLKNNTPVAIIPSSMPVDATVSVKKPEYEKLAGQVAKWGPKIDQFLNSAPQSKGPFSQHFTTFINKQIVANDLENLSDKFIPYMQTRKMTDSMRNKLIPYLQQNLGAIKAAFAIWGMMYNVKMGMVKQLDKAVKQSPVKGYLDDGTETQEGFVSQNVKLVDRLGFSRQNLAGRPAPAATARVAPEGGTRNIVVVFGGGFQPWCPWHTYSFDQAVKSLGNTPGARFYIAASNDTKERPIPFNYKEILIRQAGISPEVPVTQVITPMNPLAILNNFDKERDVFVLVRSEKDPVPYTKKDGSPAYYQPITDLNKAQPFAVHAYVLPTKVKKFNIAGKMVGSATDIRNMYAASDEEGRQRIIRDMYPNATDPVLVKKILDKYLGPLTEETLNEADPPPMGSTASPIPGTPSSLLPKPSKIDIIKHRKQMDALKRLLGH